MENNVAFMMFTLLTVYNGAMYAQNVHISVCPHAHWGTGEAVFPSFCLEIMFAQSPQGPPLCVAGTTFSQKDVRLILCHSMAHFVIPLFHKSPLC